MNKPAFSIEKPPGDAVLPYGRQWLDDDDIAAVVEALKAERITQGPLVDEFEKRLAEYCSAGYAVAVSSGTAALELACAAAGVGPGDEIITTPLTFAATASAAVRLGARPVFADIKEDTLNIDPAEIEKKLSPRTKAILPVDFAGLPSELDKIMSIAGRRGIAVIEDACHALGAEFRGRRIGGIAGMTVFSFHPVKHITTGEGGAVLTNNKSAYEEIKKLRHHGIVAAEGDEPWRYLVERPGYNFRLTDFQCALGINQMKKLDGFLARRRKIARIYDEAFSALGEVIRPPRAKDGGHAYHLYVIQLRLEHLSAGRKEVFNALRAEGIGVQVHYVPLHLQPFFQRAFGYREGNFPAAERYYERALSLPIFPAMSDDDVEDVIRVVKKVLACYRRFGR